MPKQGSVVIQNFKFGLDSRRSELTSVPGTLLRAVDCHINQGGEIEKRKSFVKWSQPAYTFGALATLGGIYTFGSATLADTSINTTKKARNNNIATFTFAAPHGLSVGQSFSAHKLQDITGFSTPGATILAVTTLTISYYNPGVDVALGAAVYTISYGLCKPPFIYQQLTSPLASPSPMSAYVAGTIYNGLPFVAATFGTDGTFCFYNGTLVEDFVGGLVLTSLESNTDQAQSLVALANSTANYTASNVSGVVTIKGTGGNNFTGVASTTSAAGVITMSQTNKGIPGSNAVAPTASFIIVAGFAGTGTPPSMSVYVNDATYITSAAVDWTGDPVSMAAAVAANINAYSGTSGYSALANGNEVLVYGPAGVAVNGQAIRAIASASSNMDGAICVSNCLFNINVPAGGVLTVTKMATTGLGEIWAGSIASGSYANTLLFLQAVAAAVMNSVATIGGQPMVLLVASSTGLMVSFLWDENYVANQTVTLTYTASGGATVSGTSALSASASPLTVTNGQATTVSVKGGVGPYKYSWSINNSAIFINNTTGDVVSFNTSVTVAQGRTGTNYIGGLATCTVTDSNGNQVTVKVNVKLS